MAVYLISKLYRNYEDIGGFEFAEPIDYSSKIVNVSSQATPIFQKVPERFITIFFKGKQRGGPTVTPVKRNLLY
jgi:hypothetical protein